MAILSKELCDKFSDCIFDITGQRPEFKTTASGSRIEINCYDYSQFQYYYDMLTSYDNNLCKIRKRRNPTGFVITGLTESTLKVIIPLLRIRPQTH